MSDRAGDVLGGDPFRLLASSWPWRSLAYLASGPPVAVAWLLPSAAALAVGVLTLPVGVGVAPLLGAALSGIPLGVVERGRLRLLGPAPTSPHRPPDGPGFRRAVVFRLREPATWRELAYGPLHCVLVLADVFVVVPALLLAAGLLTAPLQARLLPWHPNAAWAQIIASPLDATVAFVVGLVWAAVAAYLLTAYAGARAMLARTLIGRSPAEELVAVTRSRARIVDAHEAERRRIERDLHDGVQQRLTGLIMTLGLARVETDSARTRQLAERAYEEARETLRDLRDVVHGIHPWVLGDRGLGAAVEWAAERCPVPVDVELTLEGRLPPAVESAAYFVVSEALTNVARHSTATHASVRGRCAAGRLRLEVRDDGAGGADPTRGSGLTGLADRVAALDGVLRLSSPSGGPTLLQVEIPCGS